MHAVERGWERGWEGNCLGNELPLQNCQKNAPCMNVTLQSTSTWNSNTGTYVTMPLGKAKCKCKKQGIWHGSNHFSSQKLAYLKEAL